MDRLTEEVELGLPLSEDAGSHEPAGKESDASDRRGGERAAQAFVQMVAKAAASVNGVTTPVGPSASIGKSGGGFAVTATVTLASTYTTGAISSDGSGANATQKMPLGRAMLNAARNAAAGAAHIGGSVEDSGPRFIARIGDATLTGTLNDDATVKLDAAIPTNSIEHADAMARLIGSGHASWLKRS